MRRLTIACCAILLWSFAGATRSSGQTATDPAPDRKEVAERIKAVYTENLDRLTPKIRAHFATRIYRATGDTTYARFIIPYARLTVDKIKLHLAQWDTPGYRDSTADSVLADFPDSRKNEQRVRILGQQPEYVFYRDVLEQVFQMKSLGLEDELGPATDQALQRLAAVQWDTLLLNPELVRVYASKLANYMYYLKLLGIVDLEEPYTRVFQSVFMNRNASEMEPLEYQNMIYGLTHIVLAGSGYLQQWVDPVKNAWVLNYFDAHIDEILARSKPDVIAEVGLCFKLCGQKDHRVVALTQQKILEVVDPETGIVPPPGKATKVQLGKSEHRNIMAYLLLSDIAELHPGPHIRKFPAAE